MGDCLRKNLAASVFINARETASVVLTDGKPSGYTTTHFRSVIQAGDVRTVDNRVYFISLKKSCVSFSDFFMAVPRW